MDWKDEIICDDCDQIMPPADEDNNDWESIILGV